MIPPFQIPMPLLQPDLPTVAGQDDAASGFAEAFLLDAPSMPDLQSDAVAAAGTDMVQSMIAGMAVILAPEPLALAPEPAGQDIGPKPVAMGAKAPPPTQPASALPDIEGPVLPDPTAADPRAMIKAPADQDVVNPAPAETRSPTKIGHLAAKPWINAIFSTALPEPAAVPIPTTPATEDITTHPQTLPAAVASQNAPVAPPAVAPPSRPDVQPANTAPSPDPRQIIVQARPSLPAGPAPVLPAAPRQDIRPPSARQVDVRKDPAPLGAPSRESATLIRAQDVMPPVDTPKLPADIAAPMDQPQAEPSLPAVPVDPLRALPPEPKPQPMATPAQATTPPQVTPESVIPMIVRHAAHVDSSPVDVVLNPQELGHLRFEIHHRGDQVNVVLTVERPDTLDLIRKHADQLLTDLRQSGFTDASLSFGHWAQGDKGHDRPPPTALADAVAETAPALAVAPPLLAHHRQDLGGQGLNLRL